MSKGKQEMETRSDDRTVWRAPQHQISETIKVGLRSDDEVTESVRALLFGQLVRRARHVVRSYESDLYHDAKWLDARVKGPMTFYFAPRTAGTWIGDEDFMRTLSAHSWDGMRMYRVEITHERGYWYASFTRVTIS